jgi:hypothetical protein
MRALASFKGFWNNDRDKLHPLYRSESTEQRTGISIEDVDAHHLIVLPMYLVDKHIIPTSTRQEFPAIVPARAPEIAEPLQSPPRSLSYYFLRRKTCSAFGVELPPRVGKEEAVLPGGRSSPLLL